MQKEIKKILRGEKKIGIYGKGAVGQYFCQWLGLNNAKDKVQAFVVSKADEQTICMGKPVVDVDLLKEQYPDITIVICVTDKFRMEIVEVLMRHGISNYVILNDTMIDICLRIAVQYRRQKIDSILGFYYGFKYRLAYYLHKRVYIRLIGKREVKLKLWGKHNFYVRLFSRDLDFFENIYIGKWDISMGYIGEYDLDLRRFDDIIDLGANIGLFTVMSAINNPNKRIIAVEPESNNFALLKKNTSTLPNIICLQKGVWYRDAYCKVYLGRTIVHPSNTPSEGSFYIGECDKEDKDAIEGISLENIIENHDIVNYMVKMDVEGAEKEIYEKGNLQWLDQCGLLAIETHQRHFDNNKMDLYIIEKMTECGFQMHCLGENKIFERM